MCLETEAIRAMFRRSSATVPTGSTSAVNCVWTVASRALTFGVAEAHRVLLRRKTCGSAGESPCCGRGGQHGQRRRRRGRSASVSVILAGVVCEQHLLDAVNARADALARADAVALRRLLHPDFRWTSHRGEVVDRETYIDNNACEDLVWKSQSLREIAVVVVGQVGVVTAVVSDEVIRDGVAQTFRMPMTQTWVCVEEHWQCLAGHAGPLLR